MASGVVLTNLDRVFHYELHYPSIDLLGDVSLNLFLCMSLISLELDSFAGALLPITVLLACQIVFALAFATLAVFRFCGRDYDAAVLASGFVGIGLGATPVGMANMQAVTSTHGPSPRALLTLPLIGAGVLDLANAFVIDLYLRLLT